MKTERIIGEPLRTEWQRKWIGLQVTHPKIQKLADAAAGFCGRWVEQMPNERLLFIGGVSGTGKTHTAEAIISYCRQSCHLAMKNMPRNRTQTPSVASWRWPELANEFRDKNISALPDLFETDCILLDEVGAEDDPFKVVADKLCQALSRREQKFTVITSNLMPPAFAEIDPRIGDRFLRNAKVIDLTGVQSFTELLRMKR